MVKKIAICSLCFAAALQSLQADQTTVSFDSGSQTVFNQAASALTGGTTTDGNGAVLQLGYYSGATIANNFLGTWVPLSGETSLNTALVSGSNSAETYNKTSIGDLTSQGAGDGTFALSLDFVVGSATSGNSLPSSTTIPLAIRFYNGTTVAGSTFFNVVSDDAWLWKTPAAPPLNPLITMSLDNGGLEWLSTALGQSAANAFHTTVAIPEPSTLALVALGLGLIPAAWKRRRYKA